MTQHLTRGLLIAIEGIDGSGKTAQAQRLAEHLTNQGYEVVLTHEPTDSPYGRKIRSLAHSGRAALTADQELKLFMEDRKLHVANVIAPALEAKQIVVTDRYYFSTIAYQGARGLDPSAIQQANEAFAPRPDLVLYLNVSPETGLDRIREARGEEPNLFERAEMLRDIRSIFASIDELFFVEIDAERNADDVFKDILSNVEYALSYVHIHEPA